MTDNKGRTVDFRNTIIIMTSNIGSHIIQENMEQVTDKNRDEMFSKTREEVFALLKKSIRPEFLNRVDEIIMFKPLSLAEITQVVEIQINILKGMLEKNNITLTATPAAIAQIARLGFDPQYGARPIKRVIQKQVMNELSKMILEGNLDREAAIEIGVNEGQLVFTNK